MPEQELTGREKSTASQAANSTYRSGHIGVFELKTPGKKQEFKEKASTQEKTLKIVNQGKKKSGSASCFCLFFSNGKHTEPWLDIDCFRDSQTCIV